MRAKVTGIPAVSGHIAAVSRKHALTPKSKFPPRNGQGLIAHRGFQITLAGEPGNQAGIIRAGGEHIAHTKIAGAHTLTPRHPLRCQKSAIPGKENYIANGGDIITGCPGSSDRPHPAHVGRVGALQEVQGQPLGFHFGAEVCTDELLTANLKGRFANLVNAGKEQFIADDLDRGILNPC